MTPVPQVEGFIFHTPLIGSYKKIFFSDFDKNPTLVPSSRKRSLNRIFCAWLTDPFLHILHETDIVGGTGIHELMIGNDLLDDDISHFQANETPHPFTPLLEERGWG